MSEPTLAEQKAQSIWTDLMYAAKQSYGMSKALSSTLEIVALTQASCMAKAAERVAVEFDLGSLAKTSAAFYNQCQNDMEMEMNS